MTDSQITRFLAEKLFGWPCFDLTENDYMDAPLPNLVMNFDNEWVLSMTHGVWSPWKPLSNMEHTGQVVQKMRELGYECLIRPREIDLFDFMNGLDVPRTMVLAIVRALGEDPGGLECGIVVRKK